MSFDFCGYISIFFQRIVVKLSRKIGEEDGIIYDTHCYSKRVK